MSENDQSTANISNENAKRILALLKEGEEKIDVGAHRDAVLVLGNTGSGKSTFSHFIAGNNDDLLSTEVGEDSGEFIISDTNNKISYNTTVISKTTFPELLVDNETKTAYVDCPGFNDSRNEAYDIATAYFIKKVLDKAQNVKIVLIISYPSLRRGVNRNDFLQLLEHITILIKHIDKYVDSIALVASKVDNTFVMRQGIPVMVPDRTIVEQIAKFLQEVKASLKIMHDNDTYSPEFKRVEHTAFYENATKLIDALLSKQGTEYTKLGILRRPNEAGKLSQIELLQNGKKKLKKTLQQNLKYLPIDKPDIGYTVSDKSKTVIRDLVNEINNNITTNVLSIAQNLIEFYKQLEKKMYNDDMYALRDQLKNALSALKQITSINESASIEELVNTMCENFTSMNVKIPKSYIRDIKNLGKFILFLQEIGAKKFQSFAWKWAKELQSAVNAVDNSFKWYNLLGVLHKRLSEYDIQRNTTIFHAPKMEAKNDYFRIDTSSDFYTFINEINDAIDLLKTIIYEDIKEIYVDSTKIQYFDRLIYVTLKESITFICSDNSKRLQVIGEYVKLSQITENECYSNSTSVQILAKHSVFIDADLRKENDISIIAPRWNIIGLRKISLDGVGGEPHSIPKAIDTICEGCIGVHGLPVNPGTSFRHFYESTERSEINANGEDGEIGQSGADAQEVVGFNDPVSYSDHNHNHFIPKAINASCEGCDGADGLPGNPGTSGGHFFGIGSIFENSEKLTISAKGGDGGIGQHGGDGMFGRSGTDAQEVKGFDVPVSYFDRNRNYYEKNAFLLHCYTNQKCSTEILYRDSYLSNGGEIKYTIEGMPGGRGGNAGRGGAGGAGGEGGTITLIGSNNIFTSTRSGQQGSFGLHGNCGSGGQGGRGISITYSNYYRDDRSWKQTNNLGPQGEFGTCLYISDAKTANNQGLQKSNKKQFFYPTFLTVGDFTIELIKSLNNCVTKSSSQKFYAHLQNNDKLKHFYNSQFLLRSLQEFEKYYNQFTLETNQTFYQYLLTKIIEAAEAAGSANQIEERKLLESLHAIITSKLIKLKKRPQDFIPINRRKYFDALSNINTDEIGSYYANIITEKISDTMKFLESTIVKEIKYVTRSTDHEMGKLSQNEVGDEIDNLLLKKKIFESLESLMDFLHLALSLANADLFVTNRTEIVQWFPSLTFRTVEIPSNNKAFLDVEQDIDVFELKIIRQIEAISFVISNELESLQDLGNEFYDSCKKLSNIERELQSRIISQARTFTAGNATEIALLRFDEVNLALMKLATNDANLVKIIRKYQNHMKLAQFNAKMYHNTRYDNNIERLINAIDRLNDNTTHINNVMQAFFNVVIPIVKAIRTGFTSTGYKPGDIQKIRQLVQEGLAKVKQIAHRMTEGIEVDEDLQTLSEHIDEALTALIHIYDSLYSHEDRTRLDMILRFTEGHLAAGNNDTQTILTSLKNNRILYEYERSIDVFKRYVFPLDTLYPSNLTIASMPNINQNSDLKSTIATNVKTMESNLDALQNSSEYLLQGYFNGTNNDDAFYTWKNEIHGNAIDKFLSGQEIALKAIPNENDKHEMIKFDFINLGFHSSNNTIQKILNDNLINFSLRMTHPGNSYFQFCNQIHLLHSDSVSLSYNLNETGVQMESILSPYTTWILKLDPIDANENFSPLELFQREKIDLFLEGHARYMNAQNQSSCEKFITGPTATNYTALMTNNTKKITSKEDSPKSNRKRRDVSSQWSGFIPSFKDNFSFLKSINPFNFFVGTNSQNAQSSIPKSLEWGGNSSTSSNVTQLSSDLNSTLAFLDYLVRNVTKVKPYQAKTTLNLDQVRVVALEIMDRFEAMLLKLGDELDIPPSQLELDPVKLMSELEGEIINGDPSAIIKTLRNSVTLDTQFEDRFNTELVLMLNQINDRSNHHSQEFQYKDPEPLQNHYVEYAFIDHVNEAIPSHIENNNTFLQN